MDPSAHQADPDPPIGRSANAGHDVLQLAAATFNNSYAMIDAAVSGYGTAYVPENIVEQQVAVGALVQVLDEWSPMFDGYFLYYPSRRQHLPAFKAIVDALRHRG